MSRGVLCMQARTRSHCHNGYSLCMMHMRDETLVSFQQSTPGLCAALPLGRSPPRANSHSQSTICNRHGKSDAKGPPLQGPAHQQLGYAPCSWLIQFLSFGTDLLPSCPADERQHTATEAQASRSAPALAKTRRRWRASP